MTGILAYSGQQARHGARFAVDEINARGGIKSLGGAKLEVIIGDSQSKPEVGAAAAEEAAAARQAAPAAQARQAGAPEPRVGSGGDRQGPEGAAGADPDHPDFRLGKTLGQQYTNWRRVKKGMPDRYRLFFRYDSKAKVIVYAWVNDEQPLRSSGSRSDPYAVFEKMLGRGNPPDEWNALVQASKKDWIKPR